VAITAFTTPTATSSTAGVVVLNWTGGTGSGVTYTYTVYKNASATPLADTNYSKSAATSTSVTFTFTDNTANSYTFTVTATAGASTLTSALSAAVNSASPITANVYNTISATGQFMYYTFETNTLDTVKNGGNFPARNIANQATGSLVYDADAFFQNLTTDSCISSTYVKSGTRSFYVQGAGRGFAPMQNSLANSVTINGSLSFSFWILMPSNYTASDHVVFDAGGATSGSGPGNNFGMYGFSMILVNNTQFKFRSNGYVIGATNGGTTAGSDIYTTTASLPASNTFNDATWHHYVITLQSTNTSNGASTLTVYYDGNAIQTINNFQYPFSSKPLCWDTSAPWWTFGGGTNSGNYFGSTGIKCYFDNIRAYTRILSASEISNLFTSGS